MSLAPKELRQMGPTTLGIAWNDGHSSMYKVRNLRLACPCAGCVDEITREKKIREEDISETIKPKAIEPVGRYALSIIWNDGHATGIYPFDKLRSLCECPQCRAKK